MELQADKTKHLNYHTAGLLVIGVISAGGVIYGI